MATPTKRREPAISDPVDDDGYPLRARRERRLRRAGGLLLIVVAFVAVGIAISRGRSAPPKPGSPQAKADVTAVSGLLRGIPQSGVSLGSASAPVTVTEFADLECSFCRGFALGAERQLISRDVRDGRVKLVYRSLCTATCTGPLGHAGFAGQQSAAYAAGLQNRGWYYIELFYEEQGGEGSGYVTPRYLDGLARQLSGLDYAKWRADEGLPPLRQQVAADERVASAQGFGSTPTIVAHGPRGTSRPIVGEASYAQLRTAIASVQ